jgi:hypothetical protein
VGRAQIADEALLHLRRPRRVGLDELVDAGQRIEQEVRFDLRLQCLHARLHDRALELLRLGPPRGFAGGQFRPALAAGNDLDDEGGDDEQERQRGELEYAPADDHAQERDQHQRLPLDNRDPVEKRPPHHDDAPADLAQSLPDSHGARGRAWGIGRGWVGTHRVALRLVARLKGEITDVGRRPPVRHDAMRADRRETQKIPVSAQVGTAGRAAPTARKEVRMAAPMASRRRRGPAR